MGFLLVKFGAYSFTIKGDTECDRQTENIKEVLLWKQVFSTWGINSELNDSSPLISIQDTFNIATMYQILSS